jgi:hypothetical protein
VWDNAQRPVDQWIVIRGSSLRQVIIEEIQGAEARGRRGPVKAGDRVQEIRESLSSREQDHGPPERL